MKIIICPCGNEIEMRYNKIPLFLKEGKFICQWECPSCGRIYQGPQQNVILLADAKVIDVGENTENIHKL